MISALSAVAAVGAGGTVNGFGERIERIVDLTPGFETNAGVGHPLLAESEPRRVRRPAEEMAGHLREDGFTLTVTRTENKLYAAQSGSAPGELLPLSTTRFFVPRGYDFVQFDFVPDTATGQTYRLVLTQYGDSLTGRRK